VVRRRREQPGYSLYALFFVDIVSVENIKNFKSRVKQYHEHINAKLQKELHVFPADTLPNKCTMMVHIFNATVTAAAVMHEWVAAKCTTLLANLYARCSCIIKFFVNIFPR